MKSIRDFATKKGFKIIGKLTRHPEWEYNEQQDGKLKHSGVKTYSDEGGNVYHIGKGSACIVSIDGAVI